MNNDKIKLANSIINLLDNFKSSTNTPRQIGTLNKKQGINGFKPAEINTPVFLDKDKYIIYLESLDGKTNVIIPYNKETLTPFIDFI